MSGIPITPSHNAKYPSENPTAIQRHVAWWDRDNDGVIWPSDVYHGFRALGFGIFLSVSGMALICLAMSYVSGSTWFPDWAFRIWIRGIHRGKHGSDSNVYTKKGLFDERAFEEIFFTYTDPPDFDSLTLAQLFKLTKGNADPYDFFGWGANFLEWMFLYLLVWPEDGRVTKTQLRALYDVSPFTVHTCPKKQLI
ncbi:hypothetical protein M407DRAFT_75562 [Tulasnella calospora MUT 4182]|uniref:EF-hand domain-containing protein n=1 Tax=Tulasnella calospora MUT 4182 TaxID=1051891 RepID=A0A0C3Q7G5_9AGAM|nr:hypothetical protein M407DRAFT_75562 [Tulasnella calospora MUT 4182]